MEDRREIHLYVEALNIHPFLHTYFIQPREESKSEKPGARIGGHSHNCVVEIIV